MKDSVRRILLFIVVLVAGSILVLFDLPAFFLVLGIVALAMLVLFINGSIKLPRLRYQKFHFHQKKVGMRKRKSKNHLRPLKKKKRHGEEKGVRHNKGIK